MTYTLKDRIIAYFSSLSFSSFPCRPLLLLIHNIWFSKNYMYYVCNEEKKENNMEQGTEIKKERKASNKIRRKNMRHVWKNYKEHAFS